MRRRWFLALAVVVAAAVVTTLVGVSRGDDKPRKPPVANPGNRFGDDADLMRRLERHKLVKRER